jgi:hypothetical protein
VKTLVADTVGAPTFAANSIDDLVFLTLLFAHYFGTTIRTVPRPLQNRQRSPSMSFPEPAHSTHLATIWNSA